MQASLRTFAVPAPPAARGDAVESGTNYLAVYGALVRNSLVREMSFRLNFYLWLFVELLWFALQLTFNGVVYRHTDRIGTWTEWHVMMLIGASHFVQQIFQTLFLVNCSQLSEWVRSGRFDFLLLLPINTRFLVSLRHVDLGGVLSAAMGLTVVGYGAWRLGLTMGVIEVGQFMVLCAAAVLIHYSLMFLMASTCFWTVRAQGLVMAYYNLFSIARIPDAAFRGSIRAVFTLALPMLIVANVPVKALSGLWASPWEGVGMLTIAGAWFAISQLVWRRALRAYTSASS